MELSLLLAEQILVIFLMMLVGYIIVKIRLFQAKDSKVLSNIVVYVCFPCVIITSFQIELTEETAKGLLLAVAAAAAAHLFMIAVVYLLEKPLRLNGIEKVSIIYTNSGYLVIPLVTAVLGVSDRPRHHRSQGCQGCALYEHCAMRKGGNPCGG